ncbi:MAG TPA: hypothetical protein PLY25_10725 [Bacteroidia bacterium]|nr:hypothetical protein [Bacteroidia bacterium]
MSQKLHTMDITDKVISIKFADNRIPDFKEIKGTDYIKFGDDDRFPDHTLMLYNKSAKHNAIINGKVNYILGGGLICDTPEDPSSKLFLQEMSRIDDQSIKDIELHGGFYWEIIPNKKGGFITYHIDFSRIRSNEDNSIFYYKKDWADRAEQRKSYPAFKKGLDVPSIFMFKEYRPGLKTYPLPGYVASFNYIEADIEVSKHTLTNAQTGFSASKFINFYNGEPTEENKRDITRRFELLSTGSEGKKVLIGFNNDPAKRPTIDDLGASDLTKEDFSHVDNLITNNIFSGAQITHPLLFGIQQEGKLGGATELRTAYDIFKNTYVNGKQKQYEDVVNHFAKLKGVPGTYKLKDVDPVGIEITSDLIADNVSREEIRERLGFTDAEEVQGNAIVSRAINSLSPLVANKVLESMTIDEIRSLAGLVPKPGGSQIQSVDPNAAPIQAEGLEGQAVNENVKNLTAKQHQQLARIIRQYGKEQLTRQQASILLRTGLGFTDEEINGLLGDEPNAQAFSSDDELFAAFEAHGEHRLDFEVIRTKEATFDSDDESFELMQAFKDAPATATGGAGVATTPPAKVGNASPKFMIRYSYEVRPNEGAELLPTSRPFCVRMIKLDRFYSRQDIQKISGILGYNVFERVGGYWNDNGVIKKHCRHFWKANIVIKK